MQTGQSTIKDIFDGTRIFNVPIYQRSYSWNKEDNLEDFLADIVNQHPGRSYFLGSFLLHVNGNRNEFSIVDIVDGQQRLTTFTVFINEIINKLLKKSSSLVSNRTRRIFVKDDDIYKIETSNEDSAFLHDYILSEDERINIPKPSTLSQRLLVEAKLYFSKELEGYDLERLEQIYTIATTSEVLLYVVDKINAATQIFELLNDRGRKLTPLESIKSFLMYNAGLVSKNPDQVIKNIQTDFAQIYRLIEKHNIDDKDVLRYHTIAFESCPADYQEKPKDFIKKKITTLVKTHPYEALEEIKNYSSRLKNSFLIYSEIIELKDKDHHLAQLYMIGRVAPFYPILMKIYHEKIKSFPSLIRKINTFTFKASLVGLRSNGESYLYTSLRNNQSPIRLLKEFVDDNWWNINKRAKEAAQYENYYEWLNKNIVRYILFSYENHLRSKKGFPLLGIKEYNSKNSREKLSIEHISAQRAKKIKYDDEFHEEYEHNIGNLVIDHVASNSIKNNKNTNDKLLDFKLAPLMSQNEIDSSKCNWEDLNDIKEFISNREEKLKAFIINEFNL